MGTETPESSRLLNLPPEIFDPIVQFLSSEAAWRLLQCSKALFNYEPLWEQRMHTPWPLSEHDVYKRARNSSPRTRNSFDRTKTWTSLTRFLQTKPKRAAWVKHLYLDQIPTFFNSGIAHVFYQFPALTVIDARGTPWGHTMNLWLWLRINPRPNPFPRPGETLLWASEPYDTRGYDVLHRMLQQHEGRRYIVDEDRKDERPVSYRELRVHSVPGGIEFLYQGDLQWDEILWEGFDGNRISIARY